MIQTRGVTCFLRTHALSVFTRGNCVLARLHVTGLKCVIYSLIVERCCELKKTNRDGYWRTWNALCILLKLVRSLSRSAKQAHMKKRSDGKFGSPLPISPALPSVHTSGKITWQWLHIAEALCELFSQAFLNSALQQCGWSSRFLWCCSRSSSTT